MIAVATAARVACERRDYPMHNAQPYDMSILLRGKFGMRSVGSL
ncbi:hypothetical protein BCEN4_170053 [Burkholderia cenocepacia]|nr:hypothetical protein BCEN4_170053 [Burkholderia cenocepacia]